MWRMDAPIPFYQADVVGDWLCSNGVDPYDVPMSEPITVEHVDGADVIRHRVYVRDAAAGKLVTDQVNGALVPRMVERLTELRTPPPDGVGTCCGDPT
jgi:hypothetical protein